MLSAFPHLITQEFDQACIGLRRRFHQHASSPGHWQSVEIMHSFDATYLRITKELRTGSGPPADPVDDTRLHHGVQQNEMHEDDDEALHVVSETHPLIHYDIFLSPVYSVPVLYFAISDSRHRYPPTMNILYEHLIPPEYKAQVENAGVVGGVSISDHPATNRPVFFIHPCRTMEVMEASVGRRDITAEDYLLIWIGALGKCVGLNMPLALVWHNTQDTHNATDNT